MFLEGTFHVLWIYIIFGLVLCLPPLLLPPWKSLVHYFNKREISRRNSLRIFLIVFGLALAITAMVFMCLHHPYFFELEFSTFDAKYLFFNFYTLFSFILLPAGLALVGCASYIKYSSNLKLGNFFIITVGLLALGLGGSFLHDIFWCGTRTDLFTHSVNSGYDLEWWRDLVSVTSKDYRVFGFYMIVLTIILLIFASIMGWKHEGFLEKKHDRNTKISIILFSTLIFIVLGFSLYVMEYWRIFTFIPAFLSTFLGIPFSLFLSYHLGKKLAT